MHLEYFSLAQCAGYLVFVFGILAYLQKVDWKLKLLDASQNLAYIAHFLLLGNPGAATSAIVACACSLVSIRIRSLTLALTFIAVNIALGLTYFHHSYELFSVMAICFATWGMFMMSGIGMRLFLLCGTLSWLANNILCGSIGGTVMDVLIASANIVTIAKLCSARAKERRACKEKTLPPVSEGAF
jgi:hypothetical protein